MAPINGFDNLFTDKFHQRLSSGADAEQAALRRLQTMVSAAALGQGADGVRAYETDDQYQVQPLNPDAPAGADIQFGGQGGIGQAHSSDSLLTPAGQILFNESLYQEAGASFDPREILVTGLGTETLAAHRYSATSRVQASEAINAALQDGALPEDSASMVQFDGGQTRVQWLSGNGTEQGTYQDAALEDFVTDEGMQRLGGAGPSETAPSVPATDLVTEHYRHFTDAAHSEASAMAEVEQLIVDSAFGREVDWENSSHIDGQGPEMTVRFTTGVDEAGEQTFESLRVADLVSESTAQHLGISDTPVEDASPDSSIEDTPEVSVEQDTTAEVKVETDPEKEFDPTVLDEDQSVSAADADGQPEVSLDSEKQRLTTELLDIREQAGRGGADVSQRQEQLNASAGEVADTFGVDLDVLTRQVTARANTQQMPVDAQIGAVEPSELFSDAYYSARDAVIEEGQPAVTRGSALNDLGRRVRTAAAGYGVDLEDPSAYFEEPEPDGVIHHDNRADNGGVSMEYWQLDGDDGVVDSREMLTEEGQAVLGASLDVGEGETFCPELIVKSVELESQGWGSEPAPSVEIPSISDITAQMGTEDSSGRWSTGTEHTADAPDASADLAASGAHEID